MFEGCFYTKDYDQEMLDFIKKHYVWDYFNEGTDPVKYLSYSNIWNDFCLITFKPDIEYLTKQQFKEKIGMNKIKPLGEVVSGETIFKKSDLKDGMFVKTRAGKLYIVIGTGAHNATGWLDLENDYYEVLIDNSGETSLDIVEIFVKEESLSLPKHFEGEGLKSIWKRPLYKIGLEQKIKDAENNLEYLKKLLKENS